MRWSQSHALSNPICSYCCQRRTVLSQLMFWSVQMPKWNVRPMRLSSQVESLDSEC